MKNLEILKKMKDGSGMTSQTDAAIKTMMILFLVGVGIFCYLAGLPAFCWIIISLFLSLVLIYSAPKMKIVLEQNGEIDSSKQSQEFEEEYYYQARKRREELLKKLFELTSVNALINSSSRSKQIQSLTVEISELESEMTILSEKGYREPPKNAFGQMMRL